MHEEALWQSVVTRDRSCDGSFVYAVRSTGIYCNPSCSSRLPRREQVRFFTQPAEAEQAGFRPCKRCHPGTATAYETQRTLVEQICQYINTHLDEPLMLQTLSEQVHLSPYHFQRIFKSVMGITPRQYVQSARLGNFKAQLRDSESVTEALYDAGYSSTSRLYEKAPAHLGMTPTTYRKGGKGMSISYTIVTSALGCLLVAATEKGICSVCLGDSDTPLEQALFAEYPAATIQRVSEASFLEEWVQTILRYLEGQMPDLLLPVDVQATAFQWKVWEALKTIPAGTTRSYSEVAASIGQPAATRAVANACATNPVALVIPCHRVVRRSGEIGGYRWGVERKKHLLQTEAGFQTSDV